jgi:hypothetical protein
MTECDVLNLGEEIRNLPQHSNGGAPMAQSSVPDDLCEMAKILATCQGVSTIQTAFAAPLDAFAAHQVVCAKDD